MWMPSLPWQELGEINVRTYKLFKSEYGVENYCKVLVPFNDRSAFAKFRCGVAPIRLETGWYEKDVVLTA